LWRLPAETVGYTPQRPGGALGNDRGQAAIRTGDDMKTEELKEKAREELVEYALNVVYLGIVFATFTVYRRLLLAAHDITYTNYGFALIEALILGKVIMIGSIFRLGRGLEDKPLIFPTLYKTVVFTAFVALFTAAELVVKGFVSDHGIAAEFAEFTAQGYEVIFANLMVVFVALIPFFAMKELGRAVGRERIARLFFRRSPG
jgi:hypothetical protein